MGGKSIETQFYQIYTVCFTFTVPKSTDHKDKRHIRTGNRATDNCENGNSKESHNRLRKEL